MDFLDAAVQDNKLDQSEYEVYLKQEKDKLCEKY